LLPPSSAFSAALRPLWQGPFTSTATKELSCLGSTRSIFKLSETRSDRPHASPPPPNPICTSDQSSSACLPLVIFAAHCLATHALWLLCLTSIAWQRFPFANTYIM
jgi:hypothetical protein